MHHLSIDQLRPVLISVLVQTGLCGSLDGGLFCSSSNTCEAGWLIKALTGNTYYEAWLWE